MNNHAHILIENNIVLDDLKKDKIKLKELIINLKIEYNISLRKISEKLRMERETIRKNIYNKVVKKLRPH